MNEDVISEEMTQSAIAYDQQFQPRVRSGAARSNENEGKKSDAFLLIILTLKRCI